jgi:hypothetical protein
VAQFFWKAHTTAGKMCILCMSQENARGFVDMVSDVLLYRDGQEVSGIADVWLCANCLEQAARMVGSATKDETMEMAFAINERDEIIKKREDEIQAWQMRLVGLANLDVKDFDDLRRLEKERENAAPPPGLSD